MPRKSMSAEREISMSTKLSEAAVGNVMSSLVTALRVLRGEHRDLSERTLATEWRASFGDSAPWLGDGRGYFVVSQAVVFYYDLLANCEPSRRASFIDAAASEWWFAMLSLGRHDSGSLCDLLVSSFNAAEVPVPEPDTSPDGLAAAVFGAVVAIQALHRRRGGMLTDDRLRDLMVIGLAAQALSAPERVWTELTARAPVHSTAARETNTTENPIGTSRIVVDTEIRHQSAIAAARDSLHRLTEADKVIRDDLSGGAIGGQAREWLRGAGIETVEWDVLMAHKVEYDRAGMMKRLMMGDVRDELAEVGTRITKRWAARVKQARASLTAAVERRDRKINELAPAVEAFMPGPESQYPPHLRPLQTYLGDQLAADRAANGDQRVQLHTLWDFHPIADRDWRLPELTYTHPNIVLASDTADFPYADACAAARDIVLDKMSRVGPRRMLLTWIDPAGRGNSAGAFLELLEIDKSLLDEHVWSEPDEVAKALRRVSDRMAYLEQRCLKDTYADLDAYNHQAGSLAEPFHVVVVTGYPNGFSEDTAARLKTITEHGGRLGVSVVMVSDPSLSQHLTVRPSKAHPYPTVTLDSGVSQRRGLPSWWNDPVLPLARWVVGHNKVPHAPMNIDDKTTVWAPCSFHGFTPEASSAIVTGYANASVAAADVVIDAGSLIDVDGGPASSMSSLDIPLGIRGRGTTVELRLGKGLSQNVLVGGLPGSGKSTLLHTLITTAARRYSPAELELYLLDFKQGVEFQPYADGALPHARVVAVQSQRDFGLSVLRGLRDEIDRRADLFRGSSGAGSDSIAEYRERTGADLPRILVVVDEFQVMFSDDDRIAHECAQLLDHVVRQGRAFGLHTVLGTQTLRGHGSMSLLRGTLDQIAVRVVLKTGEMDSRMFLAEDNPAGARLTRPGEAIFNADNGQPEGNVEFQVALTSDDARDAAIGQARRDADAAGFTRRPIVFDGTRVLTVADDDDVAAIVGGEVTPAGRAMPLHLGLPVAIGGSGRVDFARRAGRHLAVIHRDAAVRGGAVFVAVATAVLATTAEPQVVLIECLGDDEDHAQDLRDLAGWRGVRWGRRRKLLLPELAAAAAEVRRRIDADDYSSPPLVIVVNALHRARELVDDGSLDEPQADLRTILEDGSDVGVHLVVTADSVDTIERRLGRSALTSFGARLIGQCSADVSQRVLGSAAASHLGAAYALLDEPDDGRQETIRPFPPPDAKWIATVTSL